MVSSSSDIAEIADELKQETGARILGAGDLKKMNGIITKMGQGFKIPSTVNKKEKRQKLEKFTKVGFQLNVSIWCLDACNHIKLLWHLMSICDILGKFGVGI